MGHSHVKQTGLLVVSLKGVNFFGKFVLARVSREKLRYTISAIIIFITALLIFIRLEYLLGLFSVLVLMLFLFPFLLFFFFYYCKCNKLNKVKVESSFRVALRNSIFVSKGSRRA